MQRQEKIIITIVACAFFMEGLDSTIINTALPQIANSLHIYPLDLKLALTVYLLVAGFIIPISGWLSDRFGSKVILSAALLLFSAGSVFCGFAHSLSDLIIARIIQGAGGALSLPVGRLLLVRTFSKTDFIHAMTLTATFGLLGPAFGPLVGGTLTSYVSWRAIFFVNLPIGLYGLYCVIKHIQNFKDPEVQAFDWIGFSMIGLSLAFLLFGMETAFNQLENILALIMGFIGLLGYYFYAKRKKSAIINLNLFKKRRFNFILLGGCFARLSISASPFLVPLLLQLQFSYTSMQSGLMTAFTALGMFTTKIFLKHLIKHYGLENILIFNTFLLFLSGILLAGLTLEPHFIVIAPILFLNGLIVSLQFSSMNGLTYTSIPSHLQSMGTSFISSLQQIIGSFGIAIAALLLQICIPGEALSNAPSVMSFRITFLIIALFPLVALFCFKHADLVKTKKSIDLTNDVG